MNELWNAVPGGGQEVKAKAAVLKKYRKGYEGIFQGLSYCLKYGEKDDQAPRIALFPLFLASPALDHGVDSKVRHPEWVEFIRSVKSNRGTAVRQRCCCCQLVIPLGLIPHLAPGGILFLRDSCLGATISMNDSYTAKRIIDTY